MKRALNIITSTIRTTRGRRRSKFSDSNPWLLRALPWGKIWVNRFKQTRGNDSESLVKITLSKSCIKDANLLLKWLTIRTKRSLESTRGSNIKMTLSGNQMISKVCEATTKIACRVKERAMQTSNSFSWSGICHNMVSFNMQYKRRKLNKTLPTLLVPRSTKSKEQELC